ncbi:LytR C-terminal domain-containing protein [Leucobacter soli]|uniref:LytR C-terminal domain-containing protein n=1 Tax=Leucobacter soli TaxID=2812850 RepID=UPI00361DDCDE
MGAHRLVIRPRRFWQYLVAALVGVAVLTAAGIFAVQNIGSSVTEIFDGESPAAPVEQVQAEVDPEATVAVLNGTTEEGLQDAVAEAIAEGEWGTIGFTDIAATDDVAISAVFFATEADEPAALGLAKQLGGVSTYQSDDYAKYGVQLVVLLGADYAGPGAE